MKSEPNDAPPAPVKKLKFTPKIPPRKLAKAVKPEPVETKEDVIDKEILSKLQNVKSQDGIGMRAPKTERKFSAPQVAFGHGSGSTSARTFGYPKGGAFGSKLEGQDPSAETIEKEYVEPWDYAHSFYPTTLPLRKPYSGDPEILNEREFGEASSSRPLDESFINSAVELGLNEESYEPQMLFFQFPSSFPLANPSDVDAKSKKESVQKTGCSLEELPSGFIGKILVYKSGAVKMKIGDALYDISPGSNCEFAQDVAAINTAEKHFCVLGELNRRAVVTPDVDALLESMNNTYLNE